MSQVRDDIKAIYSEAINAVNPNVAVKKHIKLEDDSLILYSEGKRRLEFRIEDYKRIFVVGAGKATAPMAKAIEDILGERITYGSIVVKYGYTLDLAFIDIMEASHPIPDKNGINGAKRIREILTDANEDDLVISLISGGGSALLPLPPDPITLEEKRETTNLLLKCGAGIHEVNSIRKHLSLVKGGNLARCAYPSTVLNLMISDVVGDDMDVIASGPFIHDRSSFSDAYSILQRYNLINDVPKSVKEYINRGIIGDINENPGKNDPIFQKITNQIIASNIIALDAAKAESEKRGYNSIILSSGFEGETKDVSFFHSVIAKEIVSSSNPLETPACVISGGESTVTITGDGLGGRNMEFALHGAVYIDGWDNITLASIGTDGTDGPTDAAGAISDGFTLRRAAEKGIEIDKYIENNDSYHFFKALGDLIITGPTNTNVMDVRIIIVNQ
ncbi:MAG: glycerate kinase [Spirochaetota bacterium]|nr:glycerate kinase [Spirochaetota bacterium]